MTTMPYTLYHYSYYLKLEEVSELVITTLDNCGLGQNYSEITYNALIGNFKVTAPGGIKDFKSTYANGIYHLDYFRLTSEYGLDEHFMFATSMYGKESKIYIDELMISHKQEEN